MQWLNYHHLYYFWTVSRCGSFTAAAKELRVAQSAVSLQVASLESFLGKKLIIRSTSKKIALSEEGRLVFSQAEEIFRQGKELVTSVKETGPLSVLRFGAMGGLSKNLQLLLLQPVLQSPQVELIVDVGDAATLLGRLLTFHIDAVLCDVPYPHSEDEPLIQKEVAQEPYCLVGRPLERKMTFAERLKKSGVYLPSKSNPATSEIERILNAQKGNALIKGYIDDIALLRLLALDTDSVVAIPEIGANRELKTGKLKRLYLFPNLYQRFYLVLRQKGARSQRILKILRQRV